MVQIGTTADILYGEWWCRAYFWDDHPRAILETFGLRFSNDFCLNSLNFHILSKWIFLRQIPKHVSYNSLRCKHYLNFSSVGEQMGFCWLYEYFISPYGNNSHVGWIAWSLSTFFIRYSPSIIHTFNSAQSCQRIRFLIIYRRWWTPSHGQGSDS